MTRTCNWHLSRKLENLITNPLTTDDEFREGVERRVKIAKSEEAVEFFLYHR